jgi:hypothetical protein
MFFQPMTVFRVQRVSIGNIMNMHLGNVLKTQLGDRIKEVVGTTRRLKDERDPTVEIFHCFPVHLLADEYERAKRAGPDSS